MGLGGAQEYYGVTPDLCTLGKAVAGGLPLSLFGGKREFMTQVKPLGNVQHSGTYNGHLIPVLAGLASLQLMSEKGFFERINALAKKFYDGFNEILSRTHVKGFVRGIGACAASISGWKKSPETGG